jgi:cytochrome c nitrite reductase small subunit
MPPFDVASPESVSSPSSSPSPSASSADSAPSPSATATAAYLTNDPAACANCHVMQEHYDSWLKSSHQNVATCNDCHLPHDFAGKWITKADNGFFHSLAFTTNDFHEPIQIKDRNRRVTQNACLHCHADYVNHMLPVETGGDMLMCVHCHATSGTPSADPPRSSSTSSTASFHPSVP